MKKETKEILSHFKEVKEYDKYDELIIKVFVGDKQVFEWYDQANIDYPEDLCWHRDISSVFYDGVEAGFKLAQKLKNEQ